MGVDTRDEGGISIGVAVGEKKREDDVQDLESCEGVHGV